ncbi:hypothetical protein B0F90DRAFT_1670229 [Multifurca ochricompacta]|uniref:Mixed lineage kinase domain-containing protein n=1 Tax=Multifurca ochricompacta TaxID=376703 RepID=A0AAD4LZ25_9AGAM|nr:hypothetical protein B0F90DRAFT_1670229 [Multifurca ochricompacta]
MSLKAIRRSTGSNALDWMVTSTQIASNVSSMLPFPPTMAAATILLAIIQIIADIKVNQEDCLRLAQRAARLLTAIGQRMDGKWEDAPQSLLESIREFEATLLSIRDFMFKAAQTKWISRFVAKTNIQDALVQYDQQLRDAATSFQVASLIEIHYAIGAMKGGSAKNLSTITDAEVVTSPIESLETRPLSCSTLESSFESIRRSRDSTESTISSFTFVDADPENLVPESDAQPPALPVPTEEEEFLDGINGETDEFGFRRYHQSDVIVRRANRKAVGWFAGTSEAQAAGQKMTIKRYDGPKDPALKRKPDRSAYQPAMGERHKNVEKSSVSLRMNRLVMPFINEVLNGSHENLPQIVGYSDGKAQTPFILLASAIGHAQQQLSLSENEAQDFIDHATYSIDNDNNVIVGLPPPREGWVTGRSYGLEESLAERALQYLKEPMNAEEAALQAGSSQTTVSLNKYKQLKGLLSSLLPRRREGPGLSSELEDLLDDADEDNPLTLRALRALCIEQSRHDQTWQARAPIGAIKTGDYGYIPGRSNDFANFVRLGNILDSEGGKAMEVVGETHGTMIVRSGGFNGFHQRQPASPFLIPNEMECWPVALPPRGNATLFVHHETGLASVNSFNRPPGFGAPAPGVAGFPRPGGFGSTPGFPHHGFGAQAHAAMPSIVYLVTSSRPDFLAYITDDPMGRPRPRETRSTSWCFSCRSGCPVGYVDYIQLDAEDVAL